MHSIALGPTNHLMHRRVKVASLWRLVLVTSIGLTTACGSGSVGEPTAFDPNVGTSPPAPTGVSVVAGDGQITIRWDDVNGASSYNLYLSPLPCVTKTNLSSLTDWRKRRATSSPFTFAELTNGKRYYVVVAAVNAYGEWGASAEVSATPGAGASSSSHFRLTGCMTVTRTSHTATMLLSGEVLIAGGFNGNFPASADLYDAASGTFIPAGTLVTPRTHHTATLLDDGRVLLAGGYGESGTLTDAELYDPSTGISSETMSLVIPRYFHTATRLPSGDVLIAGGFGGTIPIATQTLADAELYDPRTGTFRHAGRMAASRYLHTATPLPDGKVLIAGGFGGLDALASAEIYDPGTGVFTPTGEMSEPRYGHTATSLADGRVLIIGGYGRGFLASAELYDPSTGSFHNVGSLVGPRTHHTATLLADGRILIAGGYGGGPPIAELYDPTADAFSPLESMIVQRYDHTAMALPDGTVLIAGGLQLVTLASAELYNPALPP